MEKTYYLDLSKKIRIIGIPITTKCNLNCKHCLRCVGDKPVNNQEMSLESAKEIAQKISKKTEFVNLSAGYGEPLLNKNVVEIAKTFREYGTKTIIYSNCSIKTWLNLNKLFTDIFIFSADFYHYNDLDKFKKKVSEFLLFANQIEFCFADKFIISCVIDIDDLSIEIIKFLLEEIQNKYPNVYFEFHWRMYYDHKQYSYNLKQKQEFESLFRFFAKNTKVIFPTLTNIKNNICTDLFESLYFDYEGNLRKCCVFMDCDTTHNLYKMSLDEILSSKILADWRNKWVNEGEFDFCKFCPIGHGNVRVFSEKLY